MSEKIVDWISLETTQQTKNVDLLVHFKVFSSKMSMLSRCFNRTPSIDEQLGQTTAEFVEKKRAPSLLLLFSSTCFAFTLPPGKNDIGVALNDAGTVYALVFITAESWNAMFVSSELYWSSSIYWTMVLLCLQDEDLHVLHMSVAFWWGSGQST